MLYVVCLYVSRITRSCRRNLTTFSGCVGLECVTVNKGAGGDPDPDYDADSGIFTGIFVI